jgi:hypothetical protein
MVQELTTTGLGKTNRKELEAFWMPFTANRQFKAYPRIMVSAKDMHYTSEDGRQILDGTAGLWCVNAGHARPQIVEAVQKQLQTLDFAPTFRWVIRVRLSWPIAWLKSCRIITITYFLPTQVRKRWIRPSRLRSPITGHAAKAPVSG